MCSQTSCFSSVNQYLEYSFKATPHPRTAHHGCGQATFHCVCWTRKSIWREHLRWFHTNKMKAAVVLQTCGLDRGWTRTQSHAHKLNYRWYHSHAALCFFVSNMLVALLLLGCGVAGQAHAVRAWQEDGAGPKLQKSGKTFRWYLPQLPLRKISWTACCS